MTIEIFQITNMPSYTTAEIRKMIDDYDDLVREAVANGNLKDLFPEERVTLVSKISVLDQIYD